MHRNSAWIVSGGRPACWLGANFCGGRPGCTLDPFGIKVFPVTGSAALTGAELTVDELTEAIADRAGPWAVERTMDASWAR